MYRYQVASQVVLATERSTTRLVLASVRFGAVRIVSLNVRLEIERTSESYGESTINMGVYRQKHGYSPLGH